MSVWHMIGEECIHPVRAKHSDWCGLAGIVQAIVETFPQELCSDVSSAAPAFGGFILHYLQAAFV